MLKIKMLKGYAGLSLKNSQPFEVKPGINLLVGKNGSGKSNISDLISFIFNADIRPKKKVFETQFLRAALKEGTAKYTQRLAEVNGQDSNNIRQIRDGDFGENIFCEFERNNNPGSIKLTFIANNSIEYVTQRIADTTFEEIANAIIDPVANLKVERIVPMIQLNNADITLGVGFRMFNSSGDSNPVVSSIVDNFNSFFHERFREYRETDPILLRRIDELQQNISTQYENFFSQTNKKVRITLDPLEFASRALVLTEGSNIISFDSLSDGEKNLFNLIISLGTARANKPDLLIFDEPEIFMHEDMIKTLVNEIASLSVDIPDTSIIIITHSSALIENLANLGKTKVNLISIVDKQISNSNEDVDFINVLSQNGVPFSPLFISKRPNLFIENNGEKGEIHKAFFSKFFSPLNIPNIIPIGHSGQVKTYSDYADVIARIIKTQVGHKTFGIIDGDMWFIQKIDQYLKGTALPALIQILTQNNDLYISHGTANVFYFNFWEIENLYLDKEIIPFWKKKDDGTQLTMQGYLRFIENIKPLIIESWMKTYKRSQFPPIYIDNRKDYKTQLADASLKFDLFEKNKSQIKINLELLFNELGKNNLLNWLPGKEIFNALSNDFELNIDEVKIHTMSIAEKIQRILV